MNELSEDDKEFVALMHLWLEERKIRADECKLLTKAYQELIDNNEQVLELLNKGTNVTIQRYNKWLLEHGLELLDEVS